MGQTLRLNKAAFPELEKELQRRLRGDFPMGGRLRSSFTEKDETSRARPRRSRPQCHRETDSRADRRLGGSRELTNTIIKGEASFSASSYAGRNFPLEFVSTAWAR